jgi:hypothetical protein
VGVGGHVTFESVLIFDDINVGYIDIERDTEGEAL